MATGQINSNVFFDMGKKDLREKAIQLFCLN